MATSILPIKFDEDDVVTWLREFDACTLANGWKDEDKIQKFSAFLRGRAATHFYAIPNAEKAKYDLARKKLKEALCPPVQRENYDVEFETRILRTGEDPFVYKWELEQLLEKAEPTQRCTTITGEDLNIVGNISTKVTFQRFKHRYNSCFLASSNIPYDCVLG